MNHNMKINDLNFGSLFKVCFLCGTMFWVLMGLLSLLLSVIAPSALTINGQQATGVGDGIKALFLFPVIGTLVSAFVAVIGAGMMKLLGKKISFGELQIEFQDETEST